MPFSLYVHIPYCLVKCPYCDFNAYRAVQWPEQVYLDALAAELRFYAERAPWCGENVATVYFGGGTPSLFAPASIAAVLAAVATHFPLFPDPEITLEADPASVTRATLAGFREAGVNRLSFGVQSFQPMLLKTLGRLHSAADGPRVLTWAREAGFTNLTMDLIFGVPGQTLAMLADDLQQTLAAAPDHVSLYNLTYEEGTPFFRWKRQGKFRPVEEEEEVAMFSLIRETLLANGYCHYEISNFACPGFVSRHNANYWQGGGYLGIGAGAHSYSRTPGWGRRWSNVRQPKAYIAKARAGEGALDTHEQLSYEQARGEFLFLQLRQLEGVALAAFAERFGVPLVEAFPHVRDLVAEGLIREAQGCLALTEKGLLLADSIFASFV